MPAPPSPAEARRHAVADGILADARRALWLEAERALLVADLHLGYLWVERQRGALLPIVPDDTLERLLALRDEYRPARWFLLGDTVHAPARIEHLETELHRVIRALEPGAELFFILGNHDRRLPELLRCMGVSAACHEQRRLGRHVMVHGDAHDWTTVEPPEPGGRVFHGHQHPAIALSDGVATRAKVPCFLVSPRRVVLPAFSRWAAGVPWNEQPPLSPLTPADPPELALAILGERLLPVPLDPTRA